MVLRSELKERLLKYVGNKGDIFFNYFGVRCDWCAMATSYWLYEVAGITDFPKSTSCSKLKNLLKDKVNHDYKTAEIGDIILFETNGNPNDGPDHVGIVIGNSNGKIEVIEGNTGAKSGNGPWYERSSVNVYDYTYSCQAFDCIIDMSSYFTDSKDESEKSNNKLDKENLLNEIKEYNKALEDFNKEFKDYSLQLQCMNESLKVLDLTIRNLNLKIEKIL